jgi:hypothetical protein
MFKRTVNLLESNLPFLTQASKKMKQVKDEKNRKFRYLKTKHS